MTVPTPLTPLRSVKHFSITVQILILRKNLKSSLISLRFLSFPQVCEKNYLPKTHILYFRCPEIFPFKIVIHVKDSAMKRDQPTTHFRAEIYTYDQVSNALNISSGDELAANTG
jgi:hypothetical protein